MTFEEHFLPDDIPQARLAFFNLIESLKLIDFYSQMGDQDNAKQISNVLTGSLEILNSLAVRADNSQQLYLHQMMNKPQRWYPH